MVPLFLVLAAPLARMRRVPLLLWYAHWHGDWTLRLADRLCAAALSVDRGSYPLDELEAARDRARDRPRPVRTAHDRLRPTERRCGCSRSAAPRRGRGTQRCSRGSSRHSAQGSTRGSRFADRVPRRRSSRTAPSWHARIDGSPALRAHAEIADPVPRDRVPGLLVQRDALVTAADSGQATQTLDKVVYEASACAVPVIASNPVLAEYLRRPSAQARLPAGRCR